MKGVVGKGGEDAGERTGRCSSAGPKVHSHLVRAWEGEPES